MVRVSRVLIAGGYGVFGRLLTAELLRSTTAELLVAGRDPVRAEAACRKLDPSSGRLEPVKLDLSEPGELRRAADGCDAVVCAAGPFQGLRLELVGEAVDAGAHWLDIADATGWVLGVLDDAVLDERARDMGLATGPGLSTLPALSGVLVRWLRERFPRARVARIVLSIGNRNRKGTAAIASALMSALRSPILVTTPLGTRAAFRIDAPDERLLAREEIEATCWVALESPLAGRVARLAGDRPGRPHRGDMVARARLLSWLSRAWPIGTRGGCVQVEVWDERGDGAAAVFMGPDQTMAILPAAIVLRRLLERSTAQRGVIGPADWLSSEDWLAELPPRGIRPAWRKLDRRVVGRPLH